MKNKGAFRLLAALVAAAGILMASGCRTESNGHYINGTIGSNTYNKSGYVFAEAAYGETVLLATDSWADYYAGDNCWLIYFPATSMGTYTHEDGAMVYYIVSLSAMYVSNSDISVIVSTYTSEEIAGTFSGTLVYSVDSQQYAVTGEFRVQF